VSARAIAQACGIPLPILTNILKGLAHAEIVHSERGASGGYTLARSPEMITLYDLISATEGPFQLVQCIHAEPHSLKGPCDLEQDCPIRPSAYRIHRYFKAFLEGVTLAELVNDDGGQVQAATINSEPERATENSLTELTT
jgi:Rrf2 family protein